MTSESNASDVRLSNWTSATGTKPGERPLCPTMPERAARHPEWDVRS
jgi:hypothetical protein